MTTPAGSRLCPICGDKTDAMVCPRDGVNTVERSPTGKITMPEPGGHVADRYRLLDVFGRGGFGAVYRAEHLGTKQHVALKMMLPGEASDADVRRFHQEARVTAGLKSSNTVRVFDVGETPGGALFLAMELLEGQTLDLTLRQRT